MTSDAALQRFSMDIFVSFGLPSSDSDLLRRVEQKLLRVHELYPPPPRNPTGRHYDFPNVLLIVANLFLH